MNYLKIKNWEKFQHYKNRTPPWIKLHYELLTSHDWVMLADASRLLAIICMMVASRNDGVVPEDPVYFKKLANLDKAPVFKPLIDIGFLLMQADASTLQADASTKKSREEESREDKERDWSSVLPFQSEAFKSAWTDWVKYRSETRKRLTTSTIQTQLAEMRELGESESIARIRQSISNGWQGLFEVKKASQKSPMQSARIEEKIEIKEFVL